MTSRYDRRSIGINATEQYQSLLEERGRKSIRQYFTPSLRHPTSEEVAQLELIGHEWRIGDKMWKLAEKYYGDPTKWWIIAWFNQRPTDAHMTLGDVLTIPLPIDRVLGFLDV